MISNEVINKKDVVCDLCGRICKKRGLTKHKND